MTTELQTTEGTALAAKPSAFTVIERALSNGATPETVGAMLTLRRDWEADEARKAFNISLCDFQGCCPVIPKSDKGHTSPYARIDRIWRTIRPLMYERGLSVTWQVCELREAANVCHVEGTLAHKLGHGQQIRMDVPMPGKIKTKDGRDVTNAAQEMGSAYTYAQRYAICGALGIVTGEDDDASLLGTQFVTSEQARRISDLVDACRGIADFNVPTFWKWAGATAPQEVAANRFNDVVAALNRKLKPAAP